jgi:phosphatidylinositol alpha-1,6-mannosyltransferase
VTKPLPSMLALVTDAYGGRGGIAQYNRDFLGSIAEMNILSSITVLPRHAPDPPQPPRGIRQLRAHAGRTGYSIAALQTALMQPVNLVFCGHLFMAPLAAWIARIKSAKLIVQTHGIEAWSRPSKLQRAAVEQADFVLSVSRHTRAAVLSWAAIAPECVLVVPNTVREMFTPGDGSAQRAVLGLGDKCVLLTVGRMHARDRSRLEALAIQVGVSDRVKFLGAVELQTLLEIYRAADLFVMASTGEGFGVSFLEAIACGTPALGLDVAGARDALGDGKLGTAVSENELPSAIARLLQRTYSNSDGFVAAVRTRFGQEQFANNTRNVINRLTEAA